MTKPETIRGEDGITRTYQDGRLIATSSLAEARQSERFQAAVVAVLGRLAEQETEEEERSAA